jgi:cytochrome c553
MRQALAITFAAVLLAQPAVAQQPLWAYGYRTAPENPDDYSERCLGNRPADCDRPGGLARDPENAPRTLEGSELTFTVAEITSRYGPADWFPQDHPPPPSIVARGRIDDGLRACANCHMYNGRGLMQNAPVAGLSVDYFLRQLDELASGARHTSDPNKANGYEMAAIARNLTPNEARAAAEYFNVIPYEKTFRVVESDTVPVFTATINGLFLDAEDDGTEPLGNRLIELPEDSYEVNMLRNPRAGFVVYAPPGSLARGESLVTTGGDSTPPTTIDCRTCHGADLRGVPGIGPPIAGRSPSYMARQLYDFKRGTRRGTMAALMAPTVANLSDADVIAIVAYLASLDP